MKGCVDRQANPDKTTLTISRQRAGCQSETLTPPILWCLGSRYCCPIIGTTLQAYVSSLYVEPLTPLKVEIHCRTVSPRFDGFFVGFAVRERQWLATMKSKLSTSQKKLVGDRFYFQSIAHRNQDGAMYGNAHLVCDVVDLQVPATLSLRKLCVDSTTERMRLKKAMYGGIPGLLSKTLSLCLFVEAVGCKTSVVLPLTLHHLQDEIVASQSTANSGSANSSAQLGKPRRKQKKGPKEIKVKVAPRSAPKVVPEEEEAHAA
jgi:hypothetical protein